MNELNTYRHTHAYAHLSLFLLPLSKAFNDIYRYKFFVSHLLPWNLGTIFIKLKDRRKEWSGIWSGNSDLFSFLLWEVLWEVQVRVNTSYKSAEMCQGWGWGVGEITTFSRRPMLTEVKLIYKHKNRSSRGSDPGPVEFAFQIMHNMYNMRREAIKLMAHPHNMLMKRWLRPE